MNETQDVQQVQETQAAETQDMLTKLQEQVTAAEERAGHAEALLSKAKSELLTLSTGESPRFATLQKQLDEMAEQNQHMTLSLQRLQSQIVEHEKTAARWRSRFLLSEIDVVSASDRAEKAEKKLDQAVKPVPYDQKQLILEREMGWMAFTDPITKLGNSNKLDLALDMAVKHAFQTGKLMALIVFDMDNFRQLNEFAGWEHGNAILEVLGERLREKIPAPTIVARRAEDEFAMVVELENTGGGMVESPLVRCRQLADFLMKLVSEPFRLSNQDYRLTASLGISICPDDADSPTELLENAYTALALAKKSGGNQYIIYSERVYQEKERRAKLSIELSQALQENALIYLFRPVVDVQTGSLAAAVLEPYWEHPAHGRVGLDAFLSIAEDYGLMPILVEQMLGAACELSRKMKGSVRVVLTFPTSVLHIAGLAKKFMDSVTAARIKPDSLVLSLPSGAISSQRMKVTSLFSELKRWGVGRCLSIQDGSEINISGLQEVSCSLLSLSDELMNSVPAQENRRAVVQCYTDLSQRLPLPLMVHGVSDSSQAHFLALHKCHWAAGDYLSPALNLGDFVSRRRATWKFR